MFKKTFKILSIKLHKKKITSFHKVWRPQRELVPTAATVSVTSNLLTMDY